MSKSRIVNRHLGKTPPTPTSPRPADTTPPTAPGTPVVSMLSADSATLTFTASTDAVGVVGYAAFLDGSSTPAAYSAGTANSITLTGLLPGSHSVTVKAFDAVWNWSAASAAVGFAVSGQATREWPTRTTKLRFATFGDSTANTVSTVHDQEWLSAAFPASGATTLGMHFTKTNLQSFYPLAEFVGNGGISGDTTQKMLDRSVATAGPTRKALADIIDLAPDVVLLHGGSINDLINKSSSAVPAAVETCYANHVQIVDTLMSAGIVVIDSGIFGYSGADANADLVRSSLLGLNKRFADYAKTTNGKCIFIDTLGLLHGPDGAYLTGISNDGTHLNSNGGDILSSMEADICRALFGSPIGKKFQAANLLTNPVFASLTTDAKGTYPTGIVFGLTAAAIANSRILPIDGTRWATFEASPSGPATVTIKLPFDPTSMNIAANDKFGVGLDFFVEAVDGSVFVLNTLYARIDLYKSGAGRLIYEPSYNGVMGACHKIAARFSKQIMIPEPSANLTASSTFQLTLTTSELTPLRIGIANPFFGKLI